MNFGEYKLCEMCGLGHWYGNICLPCRHKDFLDWLYAPPEYADETIAIDRDVVAAKLQELFR